MIPGSTPSRFRVGGVSEPRPQEAAGRRAYSTSPYNVFVKMVRKSIFALAPEVEAARGHGRDCGSDRFGSAEPVIDYRDQEADASRNAANGLIFR